MTRWRSYLMTAALLLGALAVRLWDLGADSLWFDEVCSLEFAQRPLIAIVTDTRETNPPLYYALLHGWVGLFGTSEAALRSLSVVFGVAAVGLAGWVGHLLGGRRLAWVAMGLTAVAAMPVEYAQTARTYSLFLAASLGSFGCLLAWLRRRTWRWALAYALITAVMSLAHYYWIFNVLAQQGYLGWQVWRKALSVKAWAVVLVLVVAGCLPWAGVLISQAARVQQEGFWIPRMDRWKLLAVVGSYVTVGNRQAAWWYLALAAFGFWRLRARRGLVLVWLLCPLLIPFVLSHVTTPIFVGYYTIAAAPALYLLLGNGWLHLPGRWLKTAVAAALVVAASVSLGRVYQRELEPWRTLVRTLEQTLHPDDAVVVVGLAASPFEYYYRGSAPLHRVPATSAEGVQAGLSSDRLVPGYERVWLVIRKDVYTDPQVIREAFLARFPQAQQMDARSYKDQLFVYGFELGREPGRPGLVQA